MQTLAKISPRKPLKLQGLKFRELNPPTITPSLPQPARSSSSRFYDAFAERPFKYATAGASLSGTPFIAWEF